MFDLLLRTKTFTVEMIISKKVGNHFLLGNGSQPPKDEAKEKINVKEVNMKQKKRVAKSKQHQKESYGKEINAFKTWKEVRRMYCE